MEDEEGGGRGGWLASWLPCGVETHLRPGLGNDLDCPCRRINVSGDTRVQSVGRSPGESDVFFAAISVGLRLPSPSSVHRVPSNFTPELIKKRLKGPPEAVSNGHLLAPALDYGSGFRLGSQATAQVPPSLFA
jgi:hypothetical protein